jgi:prenyltransferase beta subunit
MQTLENIRSVSCLLSADKISVPNLLLKRIIVWLCEGQRRAQYLESRRERERDVNYKWSCGTYYSNLGGGVEK